jgi:hypothetical protein
MKWMGTAALIALIGIPGISQAQSGEICVDQSWQPATAVKRVLDVMRETKTLTSQMELAYGLSNDPAGVISYADAKRIYFRALETISEAGSPEQSYLKQQKIVRAALAAKGRDERARRILEKFELAGKLAMEDRINELNPSLVPHTQLERFRAMLTYQLRAFDTGPQPTGFVITGMAQDGESVSFNYEFIGAVGEHTQGKAYALDYNGAWLFTPVKISEEDVDRMQDDMESHYRSEVVPYLSLYNNPGDPGYEEEVDELVGALFPDRTVWPGSWGDPYGLIDDYPVVLEQSDPAGSDLGLFTGYDPDTQDVTSYDFN